MFIISQKQDMIINSDEIREAYTEADLRSGVVVHSVVIKDKEGDNIPVATFNAESEAKGALVKMAGALYNDARVFRFAKRE